MVSKPLTPPSKPTRGYLQNDDRNNDATGSRRAHHGQDEQDEDKRRLHDVDDEEEFGAQRPSATLDNARDLKAEADEEQSEDDAQEGLGRTDAQRGAVPALIVLEVVAISDDDSESEGVDAEADNQNEEAQDPKGDEDAFEKGRRLLADVGAGHGSGCCCL